MKITDKLDLLNKITRELQARYTWDEIRIFLNAFDIVTPEQLYYSSKHLSAQEALSDVSNELTISIAKELDIIASTSAVTSIKPPRNWQSTKLFRLFISHISSDKDKATRLKESLLRYGISGFVAHEDIHPTLEWQSEIERALFTMDAFLAIHTPGFSNSIWTQQEIGFAFAMRVKIISFKMGEDPTGFISKHQALPRKKRTAEEIASEIHNILDEDKSTTEKLRLAKINIGMIPDDDAMPF